MSHPPRKILIQIDPDPHASSFDAVVAVDAGVDHLLPYAGVKPADVRDLVYGAIFTRGKDDLQNTAIFIGGTDVVQGEALLQQVTDTFFGPMRVSVMLDANGANTTAAAAVVAAARHLELSETTATVLAGTGPVGQRVSRLLARERAHVRVASRSLERAKDVCDRIQTAIGDTPEEPPLEPCQTGTPDLLRAALQGAHLVVTAGAAGIRLLPAETRSAARDLQVMIDLNAVPPLGIEGAEVTDKAAQREGIVSYGAIGVGGLKMKIHRAAIQRLFTSHELVLDAEQIFALGRELQSA